VEKSFILLPQTAVLNPILKDTNFNNNPQLFCMLFFGF
jgi:hypothetical protein